MNPRDARLRNELIGLVVLKTAILAVLWLIFIRDARVSVDAGLMARHAAPAHAHSGQGEPNGD